MNTCGLKSVVARIAMLSLVILLASTGAALGEPNPV